MSEVDLRAKALKLLSAREHSRAELRRKLGDAATREEINSLLDEFEANDWLSDQRFAEAYVSANAARFGRYRLEAALRERGVRDADIAAALAKLTAEEAIDDELVRAQAAWQKKFGQLPADAAERAKQARFMQTRGFGFDVIRRVLGGLSDE